MTARCPTRDGIEPLIKFTPYQKAWRADTSRFKIGMFARQTGKTFTTMSEVVDDCIAAEVAGRRARWVILSRGERQAKEAMDEGIKPFTAAFWELYRGVLKGKAPEVEEDQFKVGAGEAHDGRDATYKQFEVVFPGGSRITALPANPDTARGFSANVVLDEFAFHRDSKKIWGALFPVISKPGLVIRVVSTPNGKSNKFYDLMTQEGSTWSRHQIDIYQAVAQGLDRDIEQLRAGIQDADLWQQEYELAWLDGATAWLDYDLIRECEVPGARLVHVAYEAVPGRVLFPKRTEFKEQGEPPRPTNYPVFVGMDIARKKDLTCIWVAELVDGVLRPREIITMHRAPFWAQHAELNRVIGRDNPVRVCIDMTGMGEGFVEEQRLKNGADRVVGVLLETHTRFAIASLLKDRMEHRTFGTPMGDQETRDDLHSITKFVSLTGAVRLAHDGESAGHGDRFWAAGLVAMAADGPEAIYAYQAASRARATGAAAIAADRSLVNSSRDFLARPFDMPTLLNSLRSRGTY